MLNELLQGQVDGSPSLSREQLKSKLKARMEELRFIADIYNENSEPVDLNALYEKILLASTEGFGLNTQDALDRFVNS